MNRDIRNVRKAINKRKSLRRLSTITKEKETLDEFDPFPQEEEKHGYYKMFPDVAKKSYKAESSTSFIIKGVLSLMLFMSSALILQSESSRLLMVKQWTRSVLQEEFPFAKVNQWYQETFGNPFLYSYDKAVTDQEDIVLPVNGHIKESFSANGKGVLIAPEREEVVTALKGGVIIFAGNDRLTDKTVVIQHADGSQTTYGFLSSLNVHLYQAVKEKDRIGTFKPSKESEHVYFSVEKNNRYLDPLQVIRIDDAK
ncbi:stage IV sporulation protein FA [Cerasibacillus quisquiliarum]|uniref:Stage IV sporulation protein FA n=1 Tax=Cerasibacillus quisquiliarum TaxID=227865 RepID=A0A511V261_9BACI|nr:M23 family metallopeptidase [Cerasibacillus quisquiliarum]MBB5145628.1 stage IV sporulation protein FA [Cerasibacillus quisquiliarum]GEN31422.1 stage IV sporulation protein FA [Cerasibacillus quisquiliarum]